MSLPSTHRAITVIEKGKVAVQERPLPQFDEDQVLVKVKAVSLNPTDWKHVDYSLKPGQSVGCDFAGDIVALGSNAQNKEKWKVGDAVAGFVRGGFVAGDNGAFQEYVATLPESIWRKPGNLPYEDAASMGGITLSTAVQALHHRLGVPYEPISTPQPFLVWAGSTGVGMYAIKLAALSGYKVVTVASKHNWDLVKSLGASGVFDYKDPDVVAHIKEWVRSQGLGPMTKGLDTISEGGSLEKCVDILEPGGTLITLLPAPKELDSKGVNVHGILVYSALKPKNENDFKQMAEWNERLPSYVEEGKLGQGTVPLKVFNGGLDDLPEAIDYVRQGKNSGQKLVVTLK